MNKFSYRPWEGISPREDVESAFLHAVSSHLPTDMLLRGVQGFCRTSGALPGRWAFHPTSRLAEVNFDTITALHPSLWF